MPNTKKGKAVQPIVPIDPPLTMPDLAVVLIKHYDLHEGLYDLMMEYRIGMGGVGPDPASLTPGVMLGAYRVGLIPSINKSPTTIDAATVNPAKKTRKKAGN